MVATLFVQLADVPGDAVEKKHVKWIVVDSIGWGLERHSNQEGGTVTRGFGKAVFQPLEFTSEAGSHTAPLMLAVANGKVFEKITIDQCKASDDPKSALEVYLQWTLEDALVESYKISGSAEDIPKETWTIKSSKIRCEYSATDPKTLKLTKVKEFSWDVGGGVMA